MKFSPPAVIFKKPKTETVLAFLYSKGWSLDQKTSRFYVLNPPGETKPETEGRDRIYFPANENTASYDELAFHFVETFSEIFGIPRQELLDLLSKSLEEIQQEVKMYPKRIQLRKALLASAQ